MELFPYEMPIVCGFVAFVGVLMLEITLLQDGNGLPLLKGICNVVVSCVRIIIEAERTRDAQIRDYVIFMQRLRDGRIKTAESRADACLRSAEVARLAVLDLCNGDCEAAKQALKDAYQRRQDGEIFF